MGESFARAIIALRKGDYTTMNALLKQKAIDIDALATIQVSKNMSRAWDEPTAYNGDGFSLLHHAVLSNLHEAAAYLLYRGANVNVSSGPNMGYTPLHLCAHTLDRKMAAFLMIKGADARAKTAAGLTLFDMVPPTETAFREYFENSMNASTDASIVSFLLKNMRKKTKLAYALTRNQFDTLFATIAWMVYVVVRREKMYLDDVLFKKFSKSVNSEEMGMWSQVRTDEFKKISNSLKIREFAQYVESYLDTKVPSSANKSPPANFEDLVVDKIRAIANSLKETGTPVALSKRQISKGLSKWTTMAYRNVQNAYLVGTPFRTGQAKYTNASLKAHMRAFAPRAPNVLPGIERPVYLYRGMHGPMAAAAILGRGLKTWKGYLAFSRNIGISEKFGKVAPNAAKTNVDKMGHVLFRLKVDTDVPRGTPWIWYVAEGTENAAFRRRKNTAVSGLPEDEVLLPPGKLEFKSPEDDAIARAILKGLKDTKNTTTRMTEISKNILGKRTLTLDMSEYVSIEEATEALTIALRNEPRKKNVALRFDHPLYNRIAHMIQLAFLHRGIVDYVIDRKMFDKPLMIDVVYVNSGNFL